MRTNRDPTTATPVAFTTDSPSELHRAWEERTTVEQIEQPAIRIPESPLPHAKTSSINPSTEPVASMPKVRFLIRSTARA